MSGLRLRTGVILRPGAAHRVRAQLLTYAWGDDTSLRLRLIMRQFLRVALREGPRNQSPPMRAFVDRRRLTGVSAALIANWRRRTECDTLHVADATNDATIRRAIASCKRPDIEHPPAQAGGFFPRRECRGVLLGAVQRPAASPFPARSGSRLPGTRAGGLRRQPGGRQPESAAHRPHAHATRHRASRSKAGLPPPGNWISPPAFGPAQSFRARPARHATGVNHAAAACTGRVAGVSPPWPGRHQRSPDGSRAWRITPPPAATCCLCRRLRPWKTPNWRPCSRAIAGVSGLPSNLVRAGGGAEPPAPDQTWCLMDIRSQAADAAPAVTHDPAGRGLIPLFGTRASKCCAR